MTISLPGELRGAQTPRVSSLPKYISSAGQEAIEFCHSFGLHLDPWQQYVLTHSLGERADGKWSAFEVGLLVPRQCGKGSILEARELAGLFLFDEKLILHSAHEFKTAQEAFRRVLSHVENSDVLKKRIKSVRTSHGEEGIELRSGARLRFVARSTGSGRGFSGDLVILDEAYNLGPKAMSALLPTLSARPNPQVWYTSSAGLEDSQQLRNVRERGVAGSSQRLAFFEWSCPAGVNPDDRQAWAQANPALGIRITEEFVESEREAMDADSFARERLGVWFDASANMVIPADAWAVISDPESEITGATVFAIDGNLERTSAAIAVAGAREDDLCHVELTDVHEGTGWVVPRVLELHERWRPRAWLLDPASAAGSWIPELQEAGIEPVLVTGREMGQACGAFYDAAVEKKSFRHRDQPELNSALAAAIRRQLADAWVWDKRNSTGLISPLYAATLAVHGFTKFGAMGAPNLW